MCLTLLLRGTMLVAVLTLLNAGAAAQPRRMSPGERAEELRARLELTQVQTDSVRAIYEAADEEMRAVFEKGEGDRAARRELMTKVREKTDKRIMLLLTEKQKERFEAYVRERGTRRPSGPGGDRPPR